MSSTYADEAEMPITIHCKEGFLKTDISKISDTHGLSVYNFSIQSKKPVFPQPITLKWKLPNFNVKAMWKPTADFNKRIQADWELNPMESRISIDAPVICLLGNDDLNVLTFASSNAVNTLAMDARLREEDSHFYCHITFFSEYERPIQNFSAQIRLDYRQLHFSESLKQVSKWWESFEDLKPAPVPSIANMPLYSTWYQFHQNLDLEVLLEECGMAYGLGYRSIIIDDGWQTNDTNRGYDYTGDWNPDRIPDMKAYVEHIHALGMKVGIWYSVPFCGKKSEAYQRFKGKFLTEDHRWAPVFDPRFPEVRKYLVGKYSNAVKDWNLDGLKLDFIDDFRLYPDTPLNQENGRDFGSINEAVDRLLADVAEALRKIKPEIFIEFRQKYIGPAIRKYGNILRAFDCPGDAVMNRVRIADIKMLSGETAVHSDMVTWHAEEKVEVAALQLINTLFGVPQLSIMLHEATQEQTDMISFYTSYWNAYADVFTKGDFTPSAPLANYPIQKVSEEGTTIIGIYEKLVVDIDQIGSQIHFHNGQLANEIFIRCTTDFGDYLCTVHDCMGNEIIEKKIEFSKGLHEIPVPACGILLAVKMVKRS